MPLMLPDLMPMAAFFECYPYERPALEALAARMQPFYDALLEA